MRKQLAVAMLVGLLAASGARAEGNYLEDAGFGTACVFINVLYMPAKFTYATLGAVTGGFAYVLTGFNFEIADKVWAPSLGGNYVVTPAHLRNQETLYFSGSIDEPPQR